MSSIEKNSSTILELYEAYGNMLYRLSYSILRSKEDAEDAVADVFYKMINNRIWPTFQSDEHEKAWLIRVTVNQCHDLQRKRVIRSYTPLEEMTELVHKEKETESVLEDVLKLGEKYKVPMILYYFEEMSIDMISKTMHLSKGTVKMRLSRGREQLKKIMEGEK